MVPSPFLPSSLISPSLYGPCQSLVRSLVSQVLPAAAVPSAV